MKTLFAISAVFAVVGMGIVTTVDVADARPMGARGTGGGRMISVNQIQVGPRVTSPAINPTRVGRQQFPQRQIRVRARAGAA